MKGIFFFVVVMLMITLSPQSHGSTDVTQLVQARSYVLIVGNNIGCRSTGSYRVAFGPKADCASPTRDCVLSVRPMDKGTLALMARHYADVRFGNSVAHAQKVQLNFVTFAISRQIENHCGWKPGIIHRAYLESLKLGGYIREK
jgi:hypothetical protein